MVEGHDESLLGKSDGEALGIIQIRPEGAAPGTEKVKRITPVIRTPIRESGIVSGKETQAQIDKGMEKLMEEYKGLFEGIGKADSVKQTHFPIPTSEQLHHKFQGSDRFSWT